MAERVKLSFEEMEKMTEWSFKKLVKEKTEKAAFKYLITEKEKQTKISNIEYKKLRIQEYLGSGCGSVKLAKVIFKARSQTLDIKTQRKWKYADNLCTGCSVKEETGQEILVCEQFNDKTELITNLPSIVTFIVKMLLILWRRAKYFKII